MLSKISSAGFSQDIATSSCGFTVVVIEGAAQSGAHLDDASGVVVVGRSGTVGQELAANALVIAFGVVVGDIFTNEMSKVSLAENNEVIKALGSDGVLCHYGADGASGSLDVIEVEKSTKALTLLDRAIGVGRHRSRAVQNLIGGFS